MHTLRRFLSPHYAVISVDAKVLKNEPWSEKTSLLVFPGGADLPYCRDFNGDGNRKIKNFVKRGGKYIGFCAGAYYAASRLEFETGTDMEVSGSRELGFYPGVARGTAFRGFQYGTDRGERAAICSIEGAENFASVDNNMPTSFVSHYNGGPTFVDADKLSNVEILSKYLEKIDVDSGSLHTNAAVVYCSVNKGAAILFGPHCEFEPSLISFSTPKKNENLVSQMTASSNDRDVFLRLCFEKLGLKVNTPEDAKVPKLTPLILSSIDPKAVSSILRNIETDIGYSDDEKTIIRAPNDTFKVSKIRNGETSKHIKMHEEDYEDPESAVKELWVFENGEKPSAKMSPYFNILSYYSHLQDNWGEQEQQSKFNATFGQPLMYGEILTSTNTLLEKNYNILRYLPDGFTAIGTTQVSGRGRGGNVWVSPMGTLAISVILRLSLEQAKQAPVVFVQYLTSMAVVEAILSYGGDAESGYAEMPVKIKWPNDVYILKPEFFNKPQNSRYVYEIDPIYAKVGGLLINTTVQDNNYVLVVGSGTNVSNAAPTTSLNLVLNQLNKVRHIDGLDPLPSYTLEGLAARFVFCLERLFSKFKHFGFRPLLSQYYKYWLHSGQIVTLGSLGNIRAIIRGISDNFGLLLVEELDNEDRPTGNVFELQPDGNSFDMFKGLITRKH